MLSDLRYAVRQLITNPGFTTVAVATLTLGIGANAAVFSLANWTLLRPLGGVDDPSRLVAVGFRGSRGFLSMSYPAMLEFGDQLTAVRPVAGEMKKRDLPVTWNGESPRPEHVGMVTGNYFETLGVTAAIGRTFGPGDERPGQPATAVVSGRFWRERLHADPSALGRTMRVLKADVTIVGVAPDEFSGIDRLYRADIWMPATTLDAVTGEIPVGFDPRASRWRRGGLFVEMFGRLAPGTSIDQARVQIRAVGAQIAAANPTTDKYLREVDLVVRSGLGVPIAARDKVSSTITILAAISALVLVIATANFANLLLFRGMRRRGQTGLRLALGASRWRLIRESMTESVLLAAIAGVAALLAAVWLVGLFRGVAFSGLPAIDSVQLDSRVLAFGSITALVVGIGCGLVPPLAMGRMATSSVLRNTGGKGSAHRSVIRDIMVIGQLAISLILLVGAGLLVTTLRNLRSVDVGFDAAHVHAFLLNPGMAGYSGERNTSLVGEVRTRLAATPGVENVSFAFLAPFSTGPVGNTAKSNYLEPGSKGVGVTDAWVSPGYFATLGIPLLAGRDFAENEFQGAAGPAGDVVVISSALARSLFGSRDPVGQMLTSLRFDGRGFADHPYHIAGIATDTKWDHVVGLDGAQGGMLLYHVLGEGPTGVGQAAGVTVLVRSGTPAVRLRPLVQAVLAELVPGVPLTESNSLRERIDQTLADQILLARAVALLTILAVGLAAVGLYGLVGYAVSERTKEFGIRMALGAQVGQVLDLVVREGAVLASAGVGLGAVGAVALSRVIAGRLFGVTPLDPSVYILAMSLLVLITLLASIIPARAATKVDPMVALRSE